MDEEQLTQINDGLKNELPGVKVFRLSIVKDEGVQAYCDRFTSALRDGLAEKRKQANVAIAAATAGAAGVGASPIPFSDAALLVPIQSAMILRILNLYGIKIANGTIVSLIGTMGVSALGKTLAGTLIKFIPGVGAAIGAVINASVASTFTAAIGFALSEMCHRQCRDMLDGKEIAFDIQQVFSSSRFMTMVKDFMSSTSSKDLVKDMQSEGERLKMQEENNG